MATSFQLGLELTNIVNPLSQVVSALGSLRLIDAIKKSGSDAITETRLAALLGRHRIDEVIKFHFREAVAQAEQSFISKYVDIVLETGAGPTVRESLKNPALFSMVIQLSMLTFAHQTEHLANAIVEAIERIVKGSGRDTDIVPDYVSLLGTLTACQQQTAAFRWAPLYESVERKIESSLRNSEPYQSGKENSKKRQRLSMTLLATPESITNRHLPFPILQSLLMWLGSLQSFPENRILHIKSDSGISTIAVWCHHVLGFGVIVRIHGVETYFGDEPRNIVIEDGTAAQTVSATLMDVADQHEPLFTLANHQNDPIISHEHRVEAFGFGRKILMKTNAAEDKRRLCSHWIIARGIASIRHSQQLDDSKPLQALFTRKFPSENNIINAGKFLFAMDNVENAILTEECGPVAETVLKLPQVNWPALVALLHVFAQIEADDLEGIGNLPLSLHVFQQLETSHHGIAKFRTKEPEEAVSLLTSFEILCRLLLGSSFSEEYIKPAVLVSAWGWSVYFNSIDALDPKDVSIRSMRVCKGVPARKDLRRARIVDGPTTTFLSSSVGQTLNRIPHIMLYPGISTSKKGGVLVGHQDDAFVVTQSFEWDSVGLLEGWAKSTHGASGRRKLGFRMMLELCVNVGMLPACECEEKSQSPREWIDRHSSHFYEEDKAGPSSKGPDTGPLREEEEATMNGEVGGLASRNVDEKATSNGEKEVATSMKDDEEATLREEDERVTLRKTDEEATLYKDQSAVSKRETLDTGTDMHPVITRWPKSALICDQVSERVITRKVAEQCDCPKTESSNVNNFWFFYVSSNPAARWLQLNDLYQSCEEDFNILMRGKATCVECAIRDPVYEKICPSLVLL